MVTRAQFARLALSLPETVQASHFGKPDFRVKGKIFAGLDHTEPRASLKMKKELQAVLVGSRPQAFVPASGAWGDSGWTMIELAHVGLGELRELVTQAWQLIAPARLVAQHSGDEQVSGELDIRPTAAPRMAKRAPKKAKKKQQTRAGAARPARKAARRATAKPASTPSAGGAAARKSAGVRSSGVKSAR